MYAFEAIMSFVGYLGLDFGLHQKYGALVETTPLTRICFKLGVPIPDDVCLLSDPESV